MLVFLIAFSLYESCLAFEVSPYVVYFERTSYPGRDSNMHNI